MSAVSPLKDIAKLKQITVHWCTINVHLNEKFNKMFHMIVRICSSTNY